MNCIKLSTNTLFFFFFKHGYSLPRWLQRTFGVSFCFVFVFSHARVLFACHFIYADLVYLCDTDPHWLTINGGTAP